MSKSKDVIKKAKEWNAYVQKQYPIEIETAIQNTLIYDETSFKDENPSKAKRKITLMDKDTTSALFHFAEENPTVLNYADYKYAGGMFLEGSTAQEEALCHQSILFPVLRSFEPSYYAINRLFKNNGLYTNKALFSKGVLFENASKATTMANVLTCASPNWLVAGIYNGASRSENNKAVRERLKWMNKILAKNEVKTFIAGAWGCGVFRQDPVFMARAILDEITYPEHLVLAIPAGRNYDAFKAELDKRDKKKKGKK